MNIEILEEAASQCAHNLFRLKYPDLDATQATKQLDECTTDAVFIINNFMRISANLAIKAQQEDEDQDDLQTKE